MYLYENNEVLYFTPVQQQQISKYIDKSAYRGSVLGNLSLTFSSQLQQEKISSMQEKASFVKTVCENANTSRRYLRRVLQIFTGKNN